MSSTNGNGKGRLSRNGRPIGRVSDKPGIEEFGNDRETAKREPRRYELLQAEYKLALEGDPVARKHFFERWWPATQKHDVSLRDAARESNAMLDRLRFVLDDDICN